MRKSDTKNRYIRVAILMLLVFSLCTFSGGCDMLNDILSNPPRDSNTEENNEGADGADTESGESAEVSSDEVELDVNSKWWSSFAADGSYYMFSDVNETSFSFIFVNLYEEEEIRGVAEFKNGGAVYSNLKFNLDGDVLTVIWTEKKEDSEETKELSLEYWRAFEYKEIDPRPMEEDEGMIPQKDALKEMESALKSVLEEGMFLKQAGAVEIDGQPCWTFTVGHGFDVKFAGGDNYAVSRDGRVYIRNDYLLKYVIQPYLLIDIERYTAKTE